MSYADVVLADAPILYYRLNDSPVNLLTSEDASLQGGSTGSWGTTTNCTLSNSTVQGPGGAHSLSCAITAAGAASYESGVYSNIAPGNVMTALASFKAATTPLSVQVNINWLTSGSVFISATTGTSATDTTSGWTQVTVTGTAPATAAKYQVVAVITGATGATTHYMASAAVFMGTNTVWVQGGGVCVDSSTSANAGTPNDSVVFGGTSAVAGGGSARFDGTTGYILGANALTNGAGPVSLEAWVQGTSPWSAGHEMAINIGGSGNYLSVLNGQPYFSLMIGGVQQTLTGSTTLDHTWHHIAGVWDGLFMRVYQDGVQVGMSQQSGTTSITSRPYVGTFDGTQLYFNGSLGDVAAYNTALSPARIADHYWSKFNPVYVAAPTGWQPWNIASHYQVIAWTTETIGGVPATVALCSGTTFAGAQIVHKVWIPTSSVTPLG